MVGERHADSVLFNIKALAADINKPAARKGGEPAKDPKLDSGLIDVRSLAGADVKPQTAAEAPRSLVAEMKARPPELTVVRPQSKTQTYVLVVAILALLGVAIALAIKALG